MPGPRLAALVPGSFAHHHREHAAGVGGRVKGPVVPGPPSQPRERPDGCRRRERPAAGYDVAMTAPGQEPDEVMTAEPDEEPQDSGTPNLDAVGDNHMPEDLRRSERERARQGEDSDVAVDED